MSSGAQAGQQSRRVYRAVLYTVTVCVVLSVLWSLLAGNRDTVILTLTAKNRIVKATYKCAQNNKDGTIDLIFQVPGNVQQLLAQVQNLSHAAQSAQDRSGNKSGVTRPTIPVGLSEIRRQQPLPGVRSQYPLSLDSRYLVNAVYVCGGREKVDYLVIVHSATAYFARRRVIRETFGGRELFGHIVQRVVFFLGRTPDPATTRSIQEEAFLNQDIVQGDFTDSYHNLTHKGVLALRWVSEFCPQAKIILKIDDDVFVNPFKLVRDILPLFSNESHSIACHLRKKGTSVIERGKGKWQVREEEFKGHRYYPIDYCNGYFVILTSDLVSPLLKAARLNPFFWVDDVYLFGLLPATVGSVNFRDFRDILSVRYDTGRRCFQEQGQQCKYLAVSQWRPEDPEKFWYLVVSNLTASERREFQVFGVS